MANAVEKLLKNQRKVYNGQDNVNTAKKLLAESTEKDREILSMIGLVDVELDNKLTSHGEYLRITEYNEDYGYCISQDVLSEVAHKYDLRMMKSRHYKYSVPVGIVSEVRGWMERTGIDVADSDDYYILAPRESFEKDIMYAEDKELCNGHDPVLLYRIAGSGMNGTSSRDGSNPVYSIVSEWGENLTFKRRVKALIQNNARTFYISSVVISSLLVLVFSYILFGLLTDFDGFSTVALTLLSIGGFFITGFGISQHLTTINTEVGDYRLDDLSSNFRFSRYRIDGIKYSTGSRFCLSWGIISIALWATMGLHDYDTVSFASVLGISHWYFAIPTLMTALFVGVCFLTGIFKMSD